LLHRTPRECLDIGIRDAAVWAGAADRAHIDAKLTRVPACCRCGQDRPSSFSALPSDRRRRSCRTFLLGQNSFAFAIRDGHEDRSHCHRVALVHVDVRNAAGVGRGYFDRGLVGFDLEQQLVLRDRIAFRDQHFEHLTLADAFAKVGQPEVTRHAQQCNA
jgi:hypothetical protein